MSYDFDKRDDFSPLEINVLKERRIPILRNVYLWYIYINIEYFTIFVTKERIIGDTTGPSDTIPPPM